MSVSHPRRFESAAHWLAAWRAEGCGVTVGRGGEIVVWWLPAAGPEHQRQQDLLRELDQPEFKDEVKAQVLADVARMREKAAPRGDNVVQLRPRKPSDDAVAQARAVTAEAVNSILLGVPDDSTSDREMHAAIAAVLERIQQAVDEGPAITEADQVAIVVEAALIWVLIRHRDSATVAARFAERAAFHREAGAR